MCFRSLPGANSGPVFSTCAGEVSNLQSAMIGLIQANFSNTVQYLKRERDTAIQDRDKHHQEAIVLRRDNTMLQEQLVSYTRSVRPSVPSVSLQI